MTTVELTGVGVAYSERRVLCDVTTPVLRGGEVVALLGPNAAGKSTLLRRVAGLVPGEGRVRAETGTASPPRICYLPQDTTSNAVLSVFESVLLAAKRDGSWRVDNETLARVDAAMRHVAIEDLALRNLAELSGGQRQLVSLAQTLAREPDVMLLDEPTSALDLRHQYAVATLVRQITRERSLVTLVSIHDINLALRMADRILMLADGRLIAFGAPREVVTVDRLSTVYGVSARIEGLDTDEPHVVIQSASPLDATSD